MSLSKYFLVMVYIARITSSQQIKFAKCLKSPDTLNKVEKSVKECQEDVKLNIIKDAFQSVNDDWDDTFFNNDDHASLYSDHLSAHDLAFSDQKPLNYDYSSPVNDHHPSPHDHHPSLHDHHPSPQDRYPSPHDHHSSPHDHHPSPHDHHSTPHAHHSSSYDHPPSSHDHHPSTHDHHPSTHEYQPSTHEHHPSTHDHHPSPYEHHTSMHEHEPTNDHRSPDHGHFNIPHHSETHSPINYQNHLIPENTEEKSKFPYHSLPSEHHYTQGTTHQNSQHSAQLDLPSDDPVEHQQHIDFTDFRKKRDAVAHHYIHPSTVTYHDKRIAGCIMQCIYEKNHAVDKLGWPTLDGLVNFYSEGVNSHGYFMATLRAVDYCLKGSSAKYHVNRRSTPEKGQTCDVAFDVFDCISDRITEYCSDHHEDHHHEDHHQT